MSHQTIAAPSNAAGTQAALADAALKDKHRAMWASGHYDKVAGEVIPAARRAPRRLARHHRWRAGPRHRRRHRQRGRPGGPRRCPRRRLGPHARAGSEIGRAEHPDLAIDWQVADAEALPWPEASYDVVLSTVGVMFAPHHQVAADEVVRVLRPGGRIGILSWTPEGFIGQLFATMQNFVPPPPAGVQPPPLWGNEAHVRELFGTGSRTSTFTRDHVEVDLFAGPSDFRTYFRDNYGPTLMAYRGLADQPERTAELDAALDRARRGRGPGGQA